MEPHRYQRKDDQDSTPEVRDSKPYRRNKDDLGRINDKRNVGVPEKRTGERNKQRPFAAPSNEDATK